MSLTATCLVPAVDLVAIFVVTPLFILRSCSSKVLVLASPTNGQGKRPKAPGQA